MHRARPPTPHVTLFPYLFGGIVITAMAIGSSMISICPATAVSSVTVQCGSIACLRCWAANGTELAAANVAIGASTVANWLVGAAMIGCFVLDVIVLTTPKTPATPTTS